MTAVVAVLAFASLVEAVVEYATKPLDGTSWQLPPFIKQYSAMAVGIGVSLWYGVNLVAVLSEILASQGVNLPVPSYDIVGMVLTGLAIGRGSNVVNDLTDLLRGRVGVAWSTARAEATRAVESEIRTKAVISGRDGV